VIKLGQIDHGAGGAPFWRIFCADLAQGSYLSDLPMIPRLSCSRDLNAASADCPKTDQRACRAEATDTA
jgi:hypothetical protein